VLVAAGVLAALLALFLAFRPQAPARGVVLADPVRSPGVANSAITQANIRSTICKHGWTRTIRPPGAYTNALKRRQMLQYSLQGSPSQYQEDHLISLELGGDPTDPRNLWPEPYPRASEMDQIENELNQKVCAGTLSLRDAQDKESELKHTQG